MRRTPFPGSRQPPLTVSELTRRLNDLIRSERGFSDVWVRGEVTTVSRGQSGHVFFTLRDPDAQLQCVMWSMYALAQTMQPRTGGRLLAHGRLNVYAPQGRYQLEVDRIRPDGEGERERALVELRERLQAEGLFSDSRKRPLPRFPSRICLVTSVSGAAVRDMLAILRRDSQRPAVVVIDTLVQGDGSAPSLVRGIETANRVAGADLIIVGRGGGAREDLWSFDSEAVVRAIATSRLPVISAVGHESDVSLADLAADIRAATPTAAAQLVIHRRREVLQRESTALRHVRGLARARLEGERRRLSMLSSSMPLTRPGWIVDSRRRRVDEAEARLVHAGGLLLERHRYRLQAAAGRLHAVSPLATLARGYAVVSTSGRHVRKVEELSPEEKVAVRFEDGVADCTVDAVRVEES